MKYDCPHFAPVRRRSLLRCLSLFAFMVLLPSAFYGKVKDQASAPPDVSSGFLPGIIDYFAGNGSNQGSYSDGSLPTQVSINSLGAIASDSLGNIYIVGNNGSLYVVYAGGSVPATLANITATPQKGRIYQITGSDTCGQILDQTCGEGKPLNQAAFGDIANLAFDSADNLYIADAISDVIRKVDVATSNVTTIAGQLNVPSSSTDIGDGRPATSATLNLPIDIKLDSFGNVYITDQVRTVARVIYQPGATSPPPVLAAEGLTGTAAQPGSINTIAGQIQQYCPNAPTAGSAGSPGGCGDYGPATGSSAFMFGLNSLAVDAAGNVYLADAYSGGGPAAAYIRVVYANGTTPPLLNLALNGSTPTPGSIYAITGYGPGTQFGICTTAPCGDGGLAADMQFGPSSSDLFITLDKLGNLYLTDSGDLAVRKIDSSGYASTIAGIDDPNQALLPNPPAAEGGAATSTQLSPFLYAVAFDPQNNLYTTDNQDYLVWRVAPLLAQHIDFPGFDPSTATYGDKPIALAATSDSNLPLSYSVTGPAHLSGAQLLITGAGTVSVVASQPGNAQYAAAVPVTQTLTVDPAMLTVTANDASKLVGTANPAFSAAITGFVNGDTQTTPGAYSGTPAFSTTAATNSPEGSYPLTVSLGSLTATNYTFTSFVPGTLTITGNTPQSITFAPLAPVIYGQAGTLNLTATASSGLPVHFQVVSGPGRIAANGSTLTITGGGTIVITANQPGSGPYEAAPAVTRSLIVNPAPLTVTGPTITTTYGTPIDPNTFRPVTITGFIGADNQSSIVTGNAQYTTVPGTPNAGTYPITVGLGSLALLPGTASSYVFSTPVNGSLIVGPAPQTINLNPTPASQLYGNFVPLTAVSSSGLPITFTVAGYGYFYNGINVTNENSATVQLVLSGVGAVTATATQPGNGNYSPAPPITQTFNVNPAPLNIGVAQFYVREQGAPNPVFQPAIGAQSGQPGGFVNGDSDIPSVISGLPALNTDATQSSPPGIYAIVPSQGTLTAANYYFVYVNGQLTVTPPGGFTITTSPPSLTIPTGLTAQATLTITPINVYQGTVTLSCGQVPANVSCLISPSTYVFPGAQTVNGTENNAQGTITITVSKNTVVGSLPGDDSIRGAATLLIPGALASLLIAFTRKRIATRGSIWGVAILATLGISMLAITSCGGSSKSMTAVPGTSTVMIVGTGTTVTGDGAVTASAPLSVTIQ